MKTKATNNSSADDADLSGLGRIFSRAFGTSEVILSIKISPQAKKIRLNPPKSASFALLLLSLF
jgi:hypothetical protein